MSRPKGPNPRLIPFSFAFDPRESDKLVRRCKALNRTASWVIREALNRYLSEPIDPAERRPVPQLEPAAPRRTRGSR